MPPKPEPKAIAEPEPQEALEYEPIDLNQTLSGKPKLKPKINLQETFKTQALIGDIDLSNKGLSDTHSTQLCQLLQSHSSGVTNLDLSHNKFTDNGILPILKAINETQIERLVLSSNKLTEKCVDTFPGVLMRNKTLKTLMM
jgi:hypothetical protein